MSQELAAKATLNKLNKEFQEAITDDSMTLAEKAIKVEKLEADMTAASKIIQAEARAKGLMGGDAAVEAQEQDLARRDYGVKSLGTQWVESGQYQAAVKAVKEQGGSFHQAKELALKAFNDGTYDGTQNVSNYNGTAGPFLYPQQIPGIVGINQIPLNVEDFLPSGAAETAVVSYIIESAWTNAADMVLEGGAKPQATVETFQRVNEPITKVAVRWKMTDEMLQDQSQVKSWLDNRGVFGVNRKVQQQLLNGNGTLPQLRGLNQRSGYETTVVSGSLAGDTGAWATAILAQMTNIRTIGFTEPNAILVNPLDWAVVQDLKDKNGQYLNGGPWGRSYGNTAPNVTTFWGLPLVSTLDQPQGTALVGNFSDAQVWNRQGITVEQTNSNEDDFNNNLVSVRVERRLGLAVYRPLSFGKVTLTA